jgi:Protein of unknown function (DUF5818)
MRHILFLSVLLLGVSWAVAQNSPASSSSQSSTSSASQSTSAGSQTTVEGCLSSSAGKYTLTDEQGKTYELTGDTSKLAEHVGHEVKITGSSGSSAAGGSAASSGSQSLEVSSVKHVSKTCKNAGGSAGGSMPK